MKLKTFTIMRADLDGFIVSAAIENSGEVNLSWGGGPGTPTVDLILSAARVLMEKCVEHGRNQAWLEKNPAPPPK